MKIKAMIREFMKRKTSVPLMITMLVCLLMTDITMKLVVKFVAFVIPAAGWLALAFLVWDAFEFIKSQRKNDESDEPKNSNSGDSK